MPMQLVLDVFAFLDCDWWTGSHNVGVSCKFMQLNHDDWQKERSVSLGGSAEPRSSREGTLNAFVFLLLY